jgi:hypothetical protein
MSETDNPDTERDRPSRHGAIMGQALALIEMAGRRDAPFEMPDTCSTCAFREGSYTNQCGGTGVVALKIVAGLDPDRFACHHGRRKLALTPWYADH